MKNKIDKKIQNILNKLKLKIIKIESGQERFLIARVKNEEKNISLFKCNITNEKKAIDRMKREIFFHSQLNNEQNEILHVPKYFKSGLKNNHYWLLREFINAKLTGEVHTLAKNSINKKYVFELVKIIFNQNYILNKIGIKKNTLKIIDKNYYINELEHDINYAKFYNIPNKELNFIRKEIKDMCYNTKKEDLIIGHGDINPQNILIKKNKIWLIDWERLSQTTIANEASFFWGSSWSDEKLRKFFIEQVVKKFNLIEKNRLVKNLSVILLLRCLGEIKYWHLLPENIFYRTKDKNSIFRAQTAVNVHLKTLKKIIHGKYL